MTDGEPIAVVLPPDEWRIVQEALDEYYYKTEHGGPGGILPSHREHSRLQREERLRVLVEVDRKIGAATGFGPLLD